MNPTDTYLSIFTYTCVKCEPFALSSSHPKKREKIHKNSFSDDWIYRDERKMEKSIKN